MKHFREAIRAEIGAPIYDSWFGKVRLAKDGNVLTLYANTPFSARWIEDNLGNEITYTVQTAANSQQLKVEYRVASGEPKPSFEERWATSFSHIGNEPNRSSFCQKL